jgi:tropomyosin
LEAKVKELEQEHTQNEREIVSLTNKNRQLEEELEAAQEKITEFKGTEAEDADHKKDSESAQRKVSMLEQELEEADVSLRDMTKK